MKSAFIFFLTLCTCYCMGQEKSATLPVNWSANTHFISGPYGENILIGGAVTLAGRHAIGIGVGTTNPGKNVAASLEYIFYLEEISKRRFHPYFSSSLDYQKYKYISPVSNAAFYDRTIHHQTFAEVGVGIQIDIYKNFSGRFSTNYILAEYSTFVFRSKSMVPEMSYQRDFFLLDAKMGSPFVFKFGIIYSLP